MNDFFNGSRNEKSCSKKNLDKLKSQGLCVMCRQPHNAATIRCSSCTKKTIENNKIRRQQNLLNKQCVLCNKDWVGDTKLCPDCKIISRDKWKNKTKTLHCVRCSEPKENPNNSSCNKCKKNLKNYQVSRRAGLKESGKCISCSGEKDTSIDCCSTCILKAAAGRWLKNRNRWSDLLDLFHKQNKKCIYTGVELIIGENASIDHIHPRSKGGLNELENLQWIDIKINKMKNNINHNEFIEICKFISNRF